VKIAWGGVAGRTLAGGLCGGAAAVAAGASAALVYGFGYGLETGWTFSAGDTEPDYTGFLSFMVAILCCLLALPVFATLFFRRAGLSQVAEIVIPATMISVVASYPFLDTLAGILPVSPSIETAIIGTLSAFVCFAAVTLGLDDRAPTSWRLTAGLVLLAVMIPVLREIF